MDNEQAKQGQESLRSFQEIAAKLPKMMSDMMGLMPNTEKKKCMFKTKPAYIQIMKDGRMLVEFVNKKDGEDFFKSLK